MHCRKYFLEAYKAGETQATIALAIINELNTLEHNAKADNLDADEQLAIRQSVSLQRLQAVIAQLQPRTMPKSALGRAMAYATHQWDSLITPFSDGRVDIDNREAERRLKVLAAGRRIGVSSFLMKALSGRNQL